MPERNNLLASLPKAELDSFRADLEHVSLTLKMPLIDPDRPIRYVFFVTSGVASLVNQPEPDSVVEFATIGREGFVGLPLLLGADSVPSRGFVQIPGEAFRISAASFRRALDQSPALRPLLMRYTLALLNQISQSTSCNRSHEVQERCARWLLQTHDRVDSDSFPLTQEFLAQMLGVHRPTVTVAAGMLQKAGLIDYSRGTITVIDRKGLEAAACSCYRIITREYERLLGNGRRLRAQRIA